MMRHSIVAVLAAFTLLVLPLPAATESNGSDTYRQLDLFGIVFERVRADYVEEVTDQKLIESAINGMLSSLDPHSSYLDAKSYREMQVQTRGEFGGLGIEVTMEAGLVKVVSPIDDTPAYRAGLKPGDFISHIDGDQILGMTLREAVERMRGKVGSDIRITIRRVGREPFDVTITRAVIKVRSVRSHAEGDIGYVRITNFSERTEKGLKEAMAKFQKDLGDRWLGVVLDLRNNPGGLLDQAVAVSDAFLDKGEIVSTRGRDSDSTRRFNAREGDLANGRPMVVLINGGSASASEIVAGALQDHRRAVLLGTRSFGKGSVQTIVPLAGRGAMRLTTARYYTPSGRSIQAKGIEPDILAEQAKIEVLNNGKRQSEADLRGALKNDTDGKETKADGKSPDSGGAKSEDTPRDYQLERALDLLRGVALFRPVAVN
ncbi:MAG: S41 family peptidase [Alphaproteobacteria bacterium]